MAQLFEYAATISSVQFSCSVVSDSLWAHELQHARPPCPSPSPRVHSNSRPLSQWCHPAISSSVVPFSSCPQSLPVSESFPISQLLAWDGQSTRVSASASFLPKNTQGWSPLEWTGWISLQSKGLSRVFSNTTVQKHQFFGTQPSSQSNSRIHEVMGPDAMIFICWMLSFKPTFSLSSFTFMHWRRKWQPTPVFLPGESQGWRIPVGCRLWGRTESDTTEVT